MSGGLCPICSMFEDCNILEALNRTANTNGIDSDDITYNVFGCPKHMD